MPRRRRSTCWPTTPTSTADPIAIDSVTQPANGTVVITGGGTGLTYQPERRTTATTRRAASPDTFAYTLSRRLDGDGVGDGDLCRRPPVAVDDAATVAEDDPATAIDVLANDTDLDGDPIAIDSVTQPANGTVVITGGGDRTDLPAEPELLQRPARRHPRHVHLHPDPGGSTATVSVTVTCVDDPPVAVDDAATVAEDDRGDGDRRAGQRHRRRRRSDRRSPR